MLKMMIKSVFLVSYQALRPIKKLTQNGQQKWIEEWLMVFKKDYDKIKLKKETPALMCWC